MTQLNQERRLLQHDNFRLVGYRRLLEKAVAIDAFLQRQRPDLDIVELGRLLGDLCGLSAFYSSFEQRCEEKKEHGKATDI